MFDRCPAEVSTGSLRNVTRESDIGHGKVEGSEAGLVEIGVLAVTRVDAEHAASHLAMRGASVVAIQKLAGHRELPTTQR